MIGYVKLKSVAELKMLTGESRINAERKFGHPFEFRSYAKIIYSTNEPPEFEYSSNAIKNRLILIEVP